MRAKVSDNEDDAIARQFTGNGNRLIGVAEIIAHDELDFLSENTASSIEIVDRQARSAQVLLAEPRSRACHWASHANQDLGRRGPRAKCRSQPNCDS
jgi:hypothetical protein